MYLITMRIWYVWNHVKNVICGYKTLEFRMVVEEWCMMTNSQNLLGSKNSKLLEYL
jgi:hypothetical protein